MQCVIVKNQNLSKTRWGTAVKYVWKNSDSWKYVKIMIKNGCNFNAYVQIFALVIDSLKKA